MFAVNFDRFVGQYSIVCMVVIACFDCVGKCGKCACVCGCMACYDCVGKCGKCVYVCVWIYGLLIVLENGENACGGDFRFDLACWKMSKPRVGPGLPGSFREVFGLFLL